MAVAPTIPHLVTPELIAYKTGVSFDRVIEYLKNNASCGPVAMAGVVPVYERAVIDTVRRACNPQQAGQVGKASRASSGLSTGGERTCHDCSTSNPSTQQV